MITFKQTIEYLKADIQRRVLLEGKPAGLISTLSVLFKCGVVTVILYRFSHYLMGTRFSFLHKILALIEHFYTKNEVSAVAQIGPGLVLGDGGGIGITRVTIAGKNCTFLGSNSITLGAMDAYDVEKDRIVLGDHCVVGARVRIMRPMQIADGTQIKNNSVVVFPVDKVGSVISGIPAKRRSVETYENVISWNPLKGGFIAGQSK
jgi:serine O-acetyltransferase